MPAGLAIGATKFLLAGCIALLAAAAVHDVATRTVPNWVSGILLVAGFVLRGMAHQLLYSVVCAALVFAVTVFFWRRRWMGGADVKLLTVSVLLVPIFMVPAMLVSISLAGGLLVATYVALWLALRHLVKPRPIGIVPRGRAAGLLQRIIRVEGRRIRRLESLPYASAIAMGAIFVIIHTV